MVRVSEITSRDQVTPDKRHIFDEIKKSRGQVRGPFAVLLNSPEVAGRIAHVGTYLRFESTLPAPDRELAIITTSRELDCGFEWAAHTKLGREAGVRDQAIEVVGKRGPLSSLAKEEALVVGYARELLRNHQVSAATFQAAKARFGEQGVTELTATIGYYGMLAYALNAFEVKPDAGAAQLP